MQLTRISYIRIRVIFRACCARYDSSLLTLHSYNANFGPFGYSVFITPTMREVSPFATRPLKTISLVLKSGTCSFRCTRLSLGLHNLQERWLMWRSLTVHHCMSAKCMIAHWKWGIHYTCSCWYFFMLNNWDVFTINSNKCTVHRFFMFGQCYLINYVLCLSTWHIYLFY